jgi:hypothetical protein
MGAASALEIGPFILPPLADASCGAIDIRIAKAPVTVALRLISGNLPRVRGTIMIVRSRKYDRIITRRAQQVFCKKLRQLGDICRNPPRLIAREQLGGCSTRNRNGPKQSLSHNENLIRAKLPHATERIPTAPVQPPPPNKSKLQSSNKKVDARTPGTTPNPACVTCSENFHALFSWQATRVDYALTRPMRRAAAQRLIN